MTHESRMHKFNQLIINNLNSWHSYRLDIDIHSIYQANDKG